MHRLLNRVMQRERREVLRAGPYERTAARRKHANENKPKHVVTRNGDAVAGFSGVTSHFRNKGRAVDRQRRSTRIETGQEGRFSLRLEFDVVISPIISTCEKSS
jgi:hypothetical protein